MIFESHLFKNCIVHRQQKLPTKFGAFWGFRLIPYASPLWHGNKNFFREALDKWWGHACDPPSSFWETLQLS